MYEPMTFTRSRIDPRDFERRGPKVVSLLAVLGIAGGLWAGIALAIAWLLS
jgi:hypothetical protein